MALQASKNLTSSIFQSKNTIWKGPNHLLRRCTSTEWSNLTERPKKKVTDMPPMSEPVRGLPKAIYANFREENQHTKVTIMPNGLRVASENRFGEFCTVGVVIDSGSRYEVAYPSGISHFLEKLAFNSTKHYPDRDEIINKLEKHGGICDSQASRDTFIYAASAYTTGLNDVIQLLAEATLRPQITPEEAAYRDNTLGLPKLCPSKNLDKIDREMLFLYLSQHYTPQRMVVAGVGVEHERLVEAVQKYFVDSKPLWEMEQLFGKKNISGVDKSVAQYTGGIEQEECDIPQFASAGLPVLSHIMIGLEGCSHQDSDFIAMCVLNMMMGGGGSFSAGGPGKGMYTRLYTNVLNRYHWMYSATAYNHAYNDTGLFCIHASAPPNYVRDMVEVIVKELVNMASSIGDQELRRAKTQLQSMLLMNLESRPVMFEDIGRQVLATAHRKRPEYFIKEIEKITKDDIVQVAKRLLMSQPSVAARGDLRKMPSLEYIQAGLIDTEGKMPSGRKLSLWR
ncbi:hypothetical protein D910_11367 [Dendroctonus ponderosae]|uniref:Alpha-MPP n=1 Tax=Dendroctonus ponderosae TaxID=77166 RepID=U4UV62_DENPD|nr:hypothetical protein D910_11367 [Dendroctonus ponderosae]